MFVASDDFGTNVKSVPEIAIYIPCEVSPMQTT